MKSLKTYMAYLTLIIILILSFPITASGAGSGLIRDEISLFTANEKEGLTSEAEKLSRKNGADFAIAAVRDTGNLSAQEYADQLYDTSGYRKNGALLLISISDRNVWLTTTGNVRDIISDEDAQYVVDTVLPYLSDKDYEGACYIYLYMCDEFLAASSSPEEKPAEEKPAEEEYTEEKPTFESGEESPVERTKPNPLVVIPSSFLGSLCLAGFWLKASSNSSSDKMNKGTKPNHEENLWNGTKSVNQSVTESVSKTWKTHKSEGSYFSSGSSSSGGGHGGAGGSF